MSDKPKSSVEAIVWCVVWRFNMALLVLDTPLSSILEGIIVKHEVCVIFSKMGFTLSIGGKDESAKNAENGPRESKTFSPDFSPHNLVRGSSHYLFLKVG